MRIITHVFPIFLLSACSVGFLNDRVVLDSQTRLTPCGGAIHGAEAVSEQFIALGETERGDFLTASSFDHHVDDVTSINCNEETISVTSGIRLKPGDILHVVAWNHGMLKPEHVGSDEIGNISAPTLQRYRLPIRYVSESTPQGLDDNETAFLTSVLTTQRQEKLGYTSDDGKKEYLSALGHMLERQQVPIWNMLIRRLKIKRIKAEGNDSPFLAITVDMPAICSDLRNVGVADPDLKLLLQAFTDRGRKFPTDKDLDEECTDNQDLATETEIFHIVGGFDSPFSVIGAAEAQVAEGSNFYILDRPPGMFNFVTVEFNGVSVKRLGWPESSWSLNAWEQSGICSSKLDFQPIQEITLSGAALPIQIHADQSDLTMTWQVRTQIYSDLNTDDRRVSRVLERTPASRNWPIGLPARMYHRNLRSLTMQDVENIAWGKPNGNVPAACLF